MNIDSIRCDEDLQLALQRLEVVFQAEHGTPEAEELERLAVMIEIYENQHYAIRVS